MENEQYLDYSEENYGQLTQIRVPLEDAALLRAVHHGAPRASPLETNRAPRPA